MAVLEQSWVKVQEKTFGKWCASLPWTTDEQVLRHGRRLNSKLKTRDLEIRDLVLDLSDGVSAPYSGTRARGGIH